MAALLDILEQPGLASEMTQDAHCPHCGAHEQYHASVQQPKYTEHECPICQRRTRLWRDSDSTLTTSGQCKHFAHIASIGGKDIIEFRE